MDTAGISTAQYGSVLERSFHPRLGIGIAWDSVLCEKDHSVYVVKGVCSLLTRALISRGSLLVAAGCDYWTASMLGYGATVYGLKLTHILFINLAELSFRC